MSLTGHRWVALVVLFAITFIIGTIPVFGLYYWKKRKEELKNKDGLKTSKRKMVLSANTYVQVLTQVGGGVLFYTVLAHMMPEILENYDTYLESNNSVFRHNDDENDSNNKPSLPIVELVTCGGFFLVYLVEELMHTFFLHAHYHEFNDNTSVNKEIKIIAKNDKPANFGTFDGQHNNGFEGSPELVAVESHNSRHTEIMMTDISVTTRQRKKSITSNSYCSEIEIIRTQTAEEKPLCVRVFDGVVIILAFSVHSLFDGISIGIQTSVSEVWTMFIAIASHKLLIAFILSVELYEKCGNFLLMTFYMLLFSIMSPIGIFIVIIMEQSITDSDGESSLAVILLSAISAGTILYIVFFEILQKDRVKNLSGIVQFISMLVGFGLMFAVSFIFQE